MRVTAGESRPGLRWNMLLIPAIVALFLFIAIRIVSPSACFNSDFFTFWLGGHLAALGQNPYLSDVWIGGHHQFGATWIPNATFVYPLPVALLFAPLGLLPTCRAFVLWVLLSQCMIFSSLLLLLRIYPRDTARSYLLPLAAGVAAFHPTMLTLLNGQVTACVLLVLAGIVYLWEQGKWPQGAILLPLLAIKPNLGVPIILFLSIYLVGRKRGSALLAGAVSGMVLVVVGWLQNPEWIVEFWSAGSAKLSQSFGISPTIWGISAFFCHYDLRCAVGYGGVITLLLLVGFAYLATRKVNPPSPKWAVSLAITVMLLATPYTWMYDQLLLAIPIVVVSMGLAEAAYPFLLTALLLLGIDALAFIMLGIAGIIGTGVWSAMIPAVVLALLMWCFSKGRLIADTNPGELLARESKHMEPAPQKN